MNNYFFILNKLFKIILLLQNYHRNSKCIILVDHVFKVALHAANHMYHIPRLLLIQS